MSHKVHEKRNRISSPHGKESRKPKGDIANRITERAPLVRLGGYQKDNLRKSRKSFDLVSEDDNDFKGGVRPKVRVGTQVNVTSRLFRDHTWRVVPSTSTVVPLPEENSGVSFRIQSILSSSTLLTTCATSDQVDGVPGGRDGREGSFHKPIIPDLES